MEEENLNFLNNVRSSTKQTDKLLEQQILENENSFEAFDSDTQINNNPNPNIINGINFEQKKTINNDNDTIEESHKKNENEMNGQDIELNTPPNKSAKIRKSKSIDIEENLDDDQKNKDMNGNSIRTNKLENKNNNKKINNKSKKQKKLINSNSTDYIGIEKENDKNNGDATYYLNLVNNKKNKRNNDFNRSIDNTEVNDKMNIYQRMFDLKMNYLLKQDKKTNQFKPKNKVNKPHTKLIKNKNNQNSEFIIKDKNEKNNNKNNKKDKNDIKNKNSNKKNNKINNINKSNNNELDKKSKEDFIISKKSKKSRMLRKNSLNSSSSNNSTKFSQTYERFLEIQEKKKEKLKQLKKLNEEKELKQCYFSPKINKKSQRIKDDFYKRQQDKIEEKKKKNEKPKFKYREEFDYKSYKNQKLIIKKNNENNKKQKASDSSDRINKLYQWENNRKQKIHERQKSVDELTKKEFSHKPKINKKSKKLAMINLEKYLYTSKGHNANNDNSKNTINECTFDRLYRDDVMKRKERQKILEKIYSPTFSPKITKYNKNVFSRKTEDENKESYIDDDNFIIKDKKSLNVSKTYSVDKNNNNNMDREYDAKSYIYTPKYNINDDEMSSEYFIDNNFAKQIRSRLFGKMSRCKNNSMKNLNKINEMKIEEKSYSDDEDDYKKNKRNSIESESNDRKFSSGKNSKSYNIYKIKVKIKNPSNFETKDRKDDIYSKNNKKKGRNRTVGFRF